MSMDERTATGRGFHLGACTHSHDSFPAGVGCNSNCPRRLHAEVDALRDVIRLVTGHFTPPDPLHDFGELWTEGPTVILTSPQSEVVERAVRSQDSASTPTDGNP